MNVSLTHDLKDLVRKKVESGQFPSEEAVVNAALRRFLTEESATPPGDATELRGGRLPGPFLEDETVLAPSDLPRPGQVVACTLLRDEARSPDLFPGE
jgi:Arc/MetJ-type ribon-helix-helix transcriptional regulator